MRYRFRHADFARVKFVTRIRHFEFQWKAACFVKVTSVLVFHTLLHY